MEVSGTFVIPIDVADEQDLYEGFDPAGLTLSESFKGYLSDFMEDRKLGDGVRLEMTSKQPSIWIGFARLTNSTSKSCVSAAAGE